MHPEREVLPKVTRHGGCRKAAGSSSPARGSVCTNSLGKLVHRHRDAVGMQETSQLQPGKAQLSAETVPETASGLILLRNIK